MGNFERYLNRTCPTSSLVASSCARLKLQDICLRFFAQRPLSSLLDELREYILQTIEDRCFIQYLN